MSSTQTETAGLEERVIVVSGLPRSGTSLMMQMLEAAGVPLLCDPTRPPDADNPRGYFEYSPVKASARDTSWLREASGRAVKVVVPLLERLPADAPLDVLLMRRSLDEVLASQQIMLRRAGAPEDPLPEERLREILAAQLREGEAWCRRHMRVLVVEHAQLLQTPVVVARDVCRFLHRPDSAEAMAASVDRALHRQRSQGRASA